jgi:hypothetical protein
MKTRRWIYPMIFAVAVSADCADGSKLSNSAAERAITNSDNFGSDKLITHTLYSKFECNRAPEEFYHDLVLAGLVQMVHRDRMNGFYVIPECSFELMPDGVKLQQQLLGKRALENDVLPLGVRSFKSITGIISSLEQKVANVEFLYTIDWSPFGLGLNSRFKRTNPSMVYSGHAVFKLYDDGWRLGEIELGKEQ